jgi:phosphoglycerate dehydrogenase-like enzyme
MLSGYTPKNVSKTIFTFGGAFRGGRPGSVNQEAILTIHLVLSSRTRGLIAAADLERMKPTAWLINTSRGAIVEEHDLISVLKNNQIAGAAIDVFDIEPLPPTHPFRTLDNILATPHIGYVSQGLYKMFYEDTVSNIRKWLDAKAQMTGNG